MGNEASGERGEDGEENSAPMSVEAKLRAQQQAGGESKIASKRTSGSETLLQRRNSNKGDIGNGAASPLTGPAPTNAQKRMSTVPKRSSTSTNAQKTSSSKVLVFPNTIELLKDYPTKIEPATDNINIVHADLKIKYGYFSQRGYYPDEPDKNNQDSFSITSACVKNKADSEAHKLYIGYYGVYDGHGKQGDLVSYYTRDNLSKNILAALQTTTKTSPEVFKALTDGHVITNANLHEHKDIDDRMSGTTAVSCVMVNRTLYISNVGDSRCVLMSAAADMTTRNSSTGQPTNRKLVPTALSSDQTPHRKDERERVKKCGARVLSMDQLEGIEPIHENWGDLVLGESIDEGGDPPRIWHPNGEYPGTAFTRSIGDRVAEGLGVFAEPEIIEYALRDGDRFVVVASDGVWEFMTNQQVADMVSDYWDDPLQACKVIVAQAYDLWLQYEVRTDDITIIILKLEEGNPNSIFRNPDPVVTASAATGASSKNKSGKAIAAGGGKENVSGKGEAPVEIVPILHSKPVRRVAHNEKRKSFIVATNITSRELTQNEINGMMVPKNEKDYLTISNYMQRNFLFQHLSVSQMNLIISVMQPVTVKIGEWVIRQGDDGDRFYIIDTGKYEVRVSSDTSPRELDKLGGNIVHTYESSATIHPGFGELSLMYGKPRAASVIATTPGTLWALDRAVFRQLVLRSIDARKNIVQALKKVELLRVLTLQQFQRLADLLNEEYYTAGTYIIREGEVGRSFYLITEGICNCTKNGGQGGDDIFLVQRKEYEYFGERALLTDEPRAANVIAKTDVKLLSISKSNFEEVLGPLADIIDEDRKQREAMANAILEAPKRLEGIELRAVVVTDPFGPITLGAFRSPKPNLCVRTFLFSEIDQLNLSDACITFFDAIRLVTLNHKPNAFIPRIHSYTRDTNCIHLLFRNMIVGDLSNILMANNKSKTSLSAPPEIHLYTIACVASALETMHGAGVIYRSVQPESLMVDSAGHVLLMDYRICKIAAGGKTFTICGVPDYLAPEQIAQTGHTCAVDLWALGVLLYEMAVGSHPFAMAQGEIATYTKISSFGSRDFPALTYPEGFNPKISALINQLIVPDPEGRLGAGQGFKRLQRVPYFDNIVWNSLATFASPLKGVCDIVMEDIVRAGMDKSVLESFSKPYEGGKWDQLIQL